MKTAVITGSTRGLGFEMAKQFCMKGVNVVINGVNEKRLEEAADKLRKMAFSGEIPQTQASVLLGIAEEICKDLES